MNAADGDRPKLSITRPARMPLISGSLPGAETGSMLGPTPGTAAGPGCRAPLFAQNGVVSSPARALAGGADLAGFFGADVQPPSATNSASRPTRDITRTVGTLAPGSKWSLRCVATEYFPRAAQPSRPSPGGDARRRGPGKTQLAQAGKFYNRGGKLRRSG